MVWMGNEFNDKKLKDSDIALYATYCQFAKNINSGNFNSLY